MNCNLRQTCCLHFTQNVMLRNFAVEFQMIRPRTFRTDQVLVITKFVSATKLEYDKMVIPYSQDKGELQKGLGHCAIK